MEHEKGLLRDLGGGGPSAPPPHPPEWGRQPPPYNFSYSPPPPPSNPWVVRVALLSLLLGILISVAGFLCSFRTGYCPFYTAVWVGPVVIVHSLAGVAAYRSRGINSYIFHLVTSVITTVATIILGAFSVHNWTQAGSPSFYHRVGKHYHCLIPTYSADHISTVYQTGQKLDFEWCLKELKLGLSANVVNAGLGGLLVILSFASAVLCCRRACAKLSDGGCCGNAQPT